MPSTTDLLVTNRDYLPVLMKLLESAKHTIEVMAYAFSIGKGPGAFDEKSAALKVARALIALKQRLGDEIEIRVYLEGSRDTAARNAITATRLERAGIKVVMGSTHAKGFCIDGEYVLFGSTNLTDQSISRNNETNVVTNRANVVAGFRKYFDFYWNGGAHGGLRLAAPLYADGDFKKPLLTMIAKARHTLEFSIYFFDLAEIERALISAHQRGVQIRGLLHDHRSFALAYVKRTHRTAERLRKGGISDLSFGPNHLFTHSKYLIADRKTLLLGTGNWLKEDVETHPQLYLRLQSAKLCQQLAEELARQTINV